MSNLTKNYKLEKPLEDEFYDINITNSNMDIIDKGLTLDVGTSTGTGNNYILDIGSITLAESNKGISFKFFADKDSTGAVTINTNYNLIKANKNPVKNLKSGAPYIITYDGGSNFFLASGSDDSDSTSVGTDGSNVKTGITFIGTDGEVHTGIYTADGTMVAADLLSGKIGYSKGNKITGAMTNNGAKTASLNCGGSYIIPKGYHNGSGKVTANSLASQTPANAAAAQIVSGYTAWVNGSKITGNATIQSLGGKNYKTGTGSITNGQPYGWNSVSINCGFKPSVVLFTFGSRKFICTSTWGDTIWWEALNDNNFTNLGGINSTGFTMSVYGNTSYIYYAWS